MRTLRPLSPNPCIVLLRSSILSFTARLYCHAVMAARVYKHIICAYDVVYVNLVVLIFFCQPVHRSYYSQSYMPTAIWSDSDYIMPAHCYSVLVQSLIIMYRRTQQTQLSLSQMCPHTLLLDLLLFWELTRSRVDMGGKSLRRLDLVLVLLGAPLDCG